MANPKSRSLGPGMTTPEQISGFLYLPFYVLLLPLGLEYGNTLFDLQLTNFQINLTYFVLNFVMIWILFRKFLTRSIKSCRFWDWVQAVILGFVLYYASTTLLTWAITLLPWEVTNFNDEAVKMLVAENRLLMSICTVVLVPVVEETLVRGLLFGTIRPWNRYAAYAVTTLFFAAIHVWQYFLVQDFQAVLLAAVPYLPAGIALAWTYEKSNTIWAPIALHMIVNAISLGLLPA